MKVRKYALNEYYVPNSLINQSLHALYAGIAWVHNMYIPINCQRNWLRWN